MLLPDLARVKTACTTLANAGEVFADEGKPLEALAMFKSAFSLNDHLRDEPVLISVLVWAKTYKQIAEQFCKHTGQFTQDPWAKALLVGVFGQVHRPDVARCLLFEASTAAQDASQTCHLHAMVKMGTTDYENGAQPESPGPLSQVSLEDKADNWLRFQWGPYVTETWGRFLEQVRKAPTDYDNVDNAERQFHSAFQTCPMPPSILAILLPEFGGLSSQFREIVAYQQLVKLGFGAIASGHAPDVSGTVDPFTGRPYRMKSTSESWTVYSVGKDRNDDGGVATGDRESASDIAFSWDGKTASLRGQ